MVDPAESHAAGMGNGDFQRFLALLRCVRPPLFAGSEVEDVGDFNVEADDLHAGFLFRLRHSATTASYFASLSGEPYGPR